MSAQDRMSQNVRSVIQVADGILADHSHTTDYAVSLNPISGPNDSALIETLVDAASARLIFGRYRV